MDERSDVVSDTCRDASSQSLIVTSVGRVLRQPGLLLSCLVVICLLAWTVTPNLFSGFSPTVGNLSEALEPPSRTHWFGTDELGRDLFSRVVAGTSLSLRTTLLAVLIAVVIGGSLGLVGGYTGGWIDLLLMRVIDVLLAFPLLLLAMALVTVLGFGPTQVSIAVGIAMTGTVARVMRAEVLRVRTSAYVEAATASGSSTVSILWHHVLPNARGPVLALAVIEAAQAILAIAALSYLGFGASPPTPEWGSLVASGQNYLLPAWWMSSLPGLTIAITVVAVNRIATELHDGRRQP